MLILVDDSAEALMSTDVEVRDRGQIGDRFWQWLRGSGVRDAPVRAVRVVMLLVLVQRVAGVAGSRSPCGPVARGGSGGSTAS